MTAARVPWNLRIAYGLPAFALAVVGIPIYVYMPKFYTDVVGVDIAVLGTLLLAVRLFDAVSDPVIGALSDRTRSPMGRRRPWLAFGIVPLTIAVFALFAPPELDRGAATLWFGAGIFCVFLFWTAVTVPYESLGPEISFDYDERTAILGLRDGLLILGTVVAAASPAIADVLVAPDLAGPARERAVWRLVALAYAPLMIGCALWCVWRVRERERNREAGPSAFRPATVVALLRNRPFAILLGSYAIAAIGSNLPATLIPFYVQYVLGVPDAASYLLLYFVTGIALLPAWVHAAHRFGKKAAWIAASALNAATFAGVFFLGPGDIDAYRWLVIASGLGFGATLAIPSAMQADVIDYEELRSGRRREGEIIGIWSVAKKLAAAAGVGFALPILGWAGYVPNAEQTEDVQLALRTLYALVPSAFNLLGLSIAILYPLDRVMHGRILEAIDTARREGSAVDPITGETVRRVA